MRRGTLRLNTYPQGVYDRGVGKLSLIRLYNRPNWPNPSYKDEERVFFKRPQIIEN